MTSLAGQPHLSFLPLAWPIMAGRKRKKTAKKRVWTSERQLKRMTEPASAVSGYIQQKTSCSMVV